MRLILGTRASPLALTQSNMVATLLQTANPGLIIELRHITTRGDQSQKAGTPLPEVGGKGLFTAELEQAMEDGEINFAVHSLKDLPAGEDKRFTVAAQPKRAAIYDVLVSRHGQGLDALPSGSTIGVSSLRRSSQLLRVRPDLKFSSIRGNIDTRLRKMRDPANGYDAIVLAEAGLNRLEIVEQDASRLPLDLMLPAPGQGALGVQCLASDTETAALLRTINCDQTSAATNAERAFLAKLGAGCGTPVGAYAEVSSTGDVGLLLTLKVRCLSLDGKRVIEAQGSGDISQGGKIGEEVAELVLEKGFNSLKTG